MASFFFLCFVMTSPSFPSDVRPCVVLDTNVVLDWLVFDNRACQPLAVAIEAQRVRWIATDEMRRELAHVLSRGTLEAWSPDMAFLWKTWHAHSHALEVTPPPLLPRLRCSDPDDQKFIELGLNGAQWLISRDRAVLKLARQATKFGLHIWTPEQWAQHARTMPSAS